MKKIILMGNPNVGKSVVFSRLTGANVIVSNYAGTTVDFTKGKILIENKLAEIIDAPGTYSLTPSDKAEEVSEKIIKKLDEQKDTLLNVLDATNLERNLFLTLELMEQKIPMIVTLNMWDETKHKGIDIDLKKLEKILGIPVVSTTALTGEGIKNLVEKIKDAKIPKVKKTSQKEKWARIGTIVKQVQKIKQKDHTILERLEDATINPLTGLPIAAVILCLSFIIIRFIGEGLIKFIFEPLFELYRPLMTSFGSWLGEGFLHNILIGRLIEGQIDFMQSMGVLTTGIFVPIGAVLPYIIAFYFILGLLEDTGYFPRLATLVDSAFHRLGMHGYAIVPVFLSFGCNVPGALSARVLSTKKQRFIASTLLAICIPCMAQTAMIFGMLGVYGVQYMIILFVTLFIVYIIGGLILNRFVKGNSPEIFLEIPPYRIPSFRAIIKKNYMRLKWFLKEAIPWLFLGVVIVNILYSIGVIEFIGSLFAPIIEGVFGLPKEATASLIVGFLRKDLAVGMLLPLGLSAMQLVIAATVLTMYFPCVATFSVLIKELGVKDMIKSAGIMILATVIVGGILRIILL